MPAPPPDRDPPATATEPRARPPLTVSAGAVSATFTWFGDRWTHAIRIDGRPFAESVEDSGDDRDPAWPASPPLVELSPLDTARGPALLGVGLAGRSHFSASVAPHPSEPDTLLFEMACRVKELPAWLGSTYDRAGTRLRIAAPAAASGSVPVTIRWTYAVGPNGVAPAPPATLAEAR